MAIVIPALLDAQLDALQVELRPIEDAVTKADSFPTPPYVRGNRVADIIRLFTDLCNSGTLTGTGIHTAADATNVITAPAATDQGTANALLNDIKAMYNLHRVMVGSNEHIGADVTNIVTAANASDLATSLTLAADINAIFNAHLALNAATGHYGADIANVLLVADPTDLDTVVAFANTAAAAYTAHIADIDAGSVRSACDNAAITGVNSLVGATITFNGNVTAALAGLTRVVNANSVNLLQFAEALPSAPAVGDTFTVDWSTVDKDLDVLTGGKGMGNSQSDPYGPGPSLINALMVIISQLGGSLPAYMDAKTDAEPFSVGSPQAGGGTLGSGGAALIADALEVMRTTIVAWTVPT